MTTTHHLADSRPDLINWAIAGSILVNIASLGTFFLPGQDDIPGAAKIVALAFAALAGLGAWGLLNHRRWAQRLTIAVTALNTLAAVPALGDPPSAAIAAAIVIGTIVGISVIATLTRPSVRGQLA